MNWLRMLVRNQSGMGATTSGIIAATGTAAGSTLMTLASPLLLGAAAGGPVGIVIGAGVVLISTILGAVGVGNGCGQTCITASNNANAIEVQMKANLAAFQAGQIDQATGLSNFSQLWTAMVSMCDQVGGSQASGCIGDRQAGACKWKDAQGNCWNWWTAYHDPIANASTAATSPSIGSLLTNLSTAELILVAAFGIGLVEAL